MFAMASGKGAFGLDPALPHPLFYGPKGWNIQKEGIKRGGRGCGASAAMTFEKMMTSEAYSPGPALVWTVTGPLELFAKQLDVESVPFAVILEPRLGPGQRRAEAASG